MVNCDCLFQSVPAAVGNMATKYCEVLAHLPILELAFDLLIAISEGKR